MISVWMGSVLHVPSLLWLGGDKHSSIRGHILNVAEPQESQGGRIFGFEKKAIQPWKTPTLRFYMNNKWTSTILSHWDGITIILANILVTYSFSKLQGQFRQQAPDRGVWILSGNLDGAYA